MNRTPLPAGTTLRFADGHTYQITGLLGRGGNALVYQARKEGSRLCYALKEVYPAEGALRREGEIIPSGSAHAAALAALKDAAARHDAALSQQASRRNFQVIAAREQYDRAEMTLPGGVCRTAANCYTVMDSLSEQGLSLGDYVRAYRPLSLAAAIGIMETVLEGYARLHQDGYLHGDCSMGNICLLGADPGKGAIGTAHIIDFGAARTLTNGETGILTGDIYSTNGYCAPELLSPGGGLRMTAACDVWSLGFLFLDLLADVSARWTGLGITEYLLSSPRARQLTGSAAKALHCDAALLSFVNAILARALEPEPAKRYQTAGEMLEEVRALGRCLRFDTSGGLDRWLFWRCAIRYCRDNEALFQTRHRPTLVDDLPPQARSLTVYARLGGEPPAPAVELLRGLGRQADRNVYLHAPGGGGKSFAVSALIQEYLSSGTRVPLYLDLAHFTPEHFNAAGMYDEIIPYLLARQYFGRTDPGVREQIKALLSQRAEQPVYFLVLDNLHKVSRDVHTKAIAAINTANSVYTAAWLVVSGRAADPMALDGLSPRQGLAVPPEADGQKQSLQIGNRLHLAPLPGESIEAAVSAVLQRPLTQQDADKLEKQRDTLCLPLFLMRYLETLAQDPHLESLPNGSAQLLKLYFDQREYQANRDKGIHDVLARHLPHIAYQYMVSGQPEHSLEEVEGWLKESYGSLRYHPACLEEFLHACAGNLFVLASTEQGLRFVHDCYQDYFASLRIASQLEQALAEDDVSLCRKIDHTWSEKLSSIWPELCAADAAAKEGGPGFSDLYDCLRGDPARSRECARRIPYNITNTFPDQKITGEYIRANYIPWLSMGAEFGDPAAQYFLGDLYLSARGVKQDVKTALQLFHKAAPQGNVSAQNALGFLYWTGDDVPQDMDRALFWFQKAAEQGDCFAQCHLGHAYRVGQGVEPDHTKAFHWYQKAAELGDSTAQNNLASLYSNGLGVEEDKSKAAFWYRKAAEQNNPAAQCNLAILYESGQGVEQDQEQALFWRNKAAELGSSQALLELGLSYLQGSGVAQDPEAALSLLTKAAEQENPLAQYILGALYYHGNGVEPDSKLAVHWLRKAAEQGHPKAQLLLGLAYHQGKGVERDPASAFFWFRKAAYQDDVSGMFRLAQAYHTGEGVAQSLSQAMYWYGRAAELDNTASQLILAQAYYSGAGMEQDKKQAYHWFAKAAEKGDGDSQNALGWGYAYGDGLPQDLEKALYWLNKAVAQNHPAALYNLGRMYQDGHGVEADLARAVSLYRAAAEGGNASAQIRLGNLLCDGVGCQQDYGEALHWFRKASKTSPTGTNNLAWMYLHGYGIEAPDYANALLLFKLNARHHNNKASYRHLGEMYEQGLGVEPDLSRALDYYKTAKSLGHKKADEDIARVEALLPQAPKAERREKKHRWPFPWRRPEHDGFDYD